MGRAEDIFNALIENGVDAVDRFIEEAASEELFLDFKRSADNGGGARLHNNDRKNLAKAISGFGNSEGGVIVWGVECSRDPVTGDVASEMAPIQQVARFRSLLEGVISGLTVPPHGKVQNHAISNEDGSGFVATLIPMSNHAPHQTVNEKRYYMRAGSDFVPVPHAVLAGMFGRRPQPNVYNAFTLSPPQVNPDQEGGVIIEVGLVLYNEGPGIAENIFLNVLHQYLPGPNCGATYSNPDANMWIGQFMWGRKMHVISRDGIRLPPDAEVIPFTITLNFTPPFDEQLKFTGICGCSGGPSYTIEIARTAEQVRDAVEEFQRRVNQHRDADECRVPIDRLFQDED